MAEKVSLESVLKVNHPNNRFDLWGGEYLLLELEGEAYAVPVRRHDTAPGLVQVGLTLTTVTREQLQSLLREAMHLYPDAKCFAFVQTSTPLLENWNEHNIYTYIRLPKTIEEFNALLSSKTRYNVKWYPKKIRKDIGEIEFEHLSQSELFPPYLERFYAWKKGNRKFAWMHALAEGQITDVFLMKIAGKMVAVGLVSDCGSSAYFLNFSYDDEYNKYSVGMVLYYHIIEELIHAGKSFFFLGGGEYEYKRRYNGTVVPVYNAYIAPRLSWGESLRLQLGQCMERLIQKIGLPALYRRLIHRIYAKLFIPRCYAVLYQQLLETGYSLQQYKRDILPYLLQ